MKVYHCLLPLVIEVQLYVSLVWATRVNDSTQANTLDTMDNDVEAVFNNNNNNKGFCKTAHRGFDRTEKKDDKRD